VNSDLTIVTGIWDLARDRAGEGFRRDFTHYERHFAQLLAADVPMVVFGDPSLQAFVDEHRGNRPTDFRAKPASAFRTGFDFYDRVQAIRTDPAWSGQAEWLGRSPQATLELYNPMVMSKMFLLHDASVWNPFGSTRFAWIDGAITSTVHPGYFTHDHVFERVGAMLDRFLFVSFPYEGGTEVHGFAREGMRRFAGADTAYVCRGGFFGGHVDCLSEVNGHYYSLLSASLHEGLMGTEESVFTLMAHDDPELYQRFALREEDGGLLGPFFEAVKALPRALPPTPPVRTRPTRVRRSRAEREAATRRVDGYIITYNAPDQLEAVIRRWTAGFRFDRLFVLDHSTEPAAQAANAAIIAHAGAQRLLHPKGNGGISGGRQFVAEHFAASDAEYYVFIEDDMFLNDESAPPVCRNGFRSTAPNLRETLVKIMELEGFDFLKLSFTEFYGDHRTQFAWYNVPAALRLQRWPDKPKLPTLGLDPDAPRSEFDAIGCVDGLSYIDGEVYYSNWPQIVSREGNQRLFLETVFESPWEQTWMSHFYQLTLRGALHPAVLLASLVTHDRFHHYGADERREN
jgi:hypothetical protein